MAGGVERWQCGSTAALPPRGGGPAPRARCPQGPVTPVLPLRFPGPPHSASIPSSCASAARPQEARDPHQRTRTRNASRSASTRSRSTPARSRNTPTRPTGRRPRTPRRPRLSDRDRQATVIDEISKLLRGLDHCLPRPSRLARPSLPIAARSPARAHGSSFCAELQEPSTRRQATSRHCRPGSRRPMCGVFSRACGGQGALSPRDEQRSPDRPCSGSRCHRFSE